MAWKATFSESLSRCTVTSQIRQLYQSNRKSLFKKRCLPSLWCVWISLQVELPGLSQVSLIRPPPSLHICLRLLSFVFANVFTSSWFLNLLTCSPPSDWWIISQTPSSSCQWAGTAAQVRRRTSSLLRWHPRRSCLQSGLYITIIIPLCSTSFIALLNGGSEVTAEVIGSDSSWMMVFVIN